MDHLHVNLILAFVDDFVKLEKEKQAIMQSEKVMHKNHLGPLVEYVQGRVSSVTELQKKLHDFVGKELDAEFSNDDVEWIDDQF